MRLGFMFSSKDDSALSRRICSVVDGSRSHAMIRIETNDGQEEYWESWHKKDELTGKDGVRGPRSMADLLAWEQESEKHHLTIQDYLPLTAGEVLTAYAKLLWARENIEYAHVQLGLNWFHNRLHIRLGSRLGSSQKWHCSETGLRVLPPRLWPEFMIPDIIADMVTPSGEFGLMEHAAAVLRGHGTHGI